MPQSKRVDLPPQSIPAPSIVEILEAPTLEEQHRMMMQNFRVVLEPKPQPAVVYLTRTFTTYSAYEDPV
jgi:hypothetical protein